MHLRSVRVEFEMSVAKDSSTLLSHGASLPCSTVPYQLVASLSLLSPQLVAACRERLRIILYWNDLVSSLAAPSHTWLYLGALLTHGWVVFFLSSRALIWESEKHEKETGSVTNITSKERRAAKGVMNLHNSFIGKLSAQLKSLSSPHSLSLIWD